MSKIRVHELAKKLNKTSKDIIDTLKKFGVEKTALSTVDDKEAEKVKNFYTPKKEPEKKKMSNTKLNSSENKQEKKNNNNNNPNNKKEYKKNFKNNRNDKNEKGDRPFNKDKKFNDNRVDRPRRDRQQGEQKRDGYKKDGQRREGFKKDGQRFSDRNQQPRNNGEKKFGDRNQQSGSRPFNKQGGSGQKSYSKQSDKEPITSAIKANTRKQDSKKPQKKYDYKKNKKAENKIGLEKIQKSITKKAVKKKVSVTEVEVPENIILSDFANLIKIPATQLIKKLMLQGKMCTLNDVIDYDTAEELALEHNIICTKEITVDVIEELLREKHEDAEENMVKVPPVVCVMGHVDHGKTSLLDAIRNTNAVSKESGGITQHIGASQVERDGELITFLDTPGHEAFTAMRLRGAQSTNIAILVVAADDGVMPQTIEAINHAKAANIEIIVAINKIDKPAANIDRVKKDLSENGILVSDWGGEIDCVPVSAHTGEGIDDLLDMVLLTAEVLELKANPNRTARGLVLEAKMDPKKGKVASLLVQKGTLRVGDPIAVGTAYGKVRAMINFKGERINEAGPSTPVEIIGLNEVPMAGETFVVTDSDKEARNFAATYMQEERKKMLEATKSRLSLDDLFEQIKEGNLKELNIIVKADVQGSVEAIKQSLGKLSNEEVIVKIIHGGVGTITESDVILASASNAIMIGFNVKIDPVAADIISRDKIDCRLYSVIYNAIEDVQDAMKGMLEPVFEEKTIGKLFVRQTFKASGVGVIAGCYVESGYITKNAKVRVYRDNKMIHEGAMASLKRFKDEVKEVKTGFECGVVLDGYDDIQVDDTFEAYIMVQVER